MTKKILIVLTSAKDMPWGRESGFWLEELAAPYVAFKEKGYNITLSSILGGEPPLDAGSLAAHFITEECKKFQEDSEAQEALKNTIPLKTFVGKASEFDAIFLPGGHGTVVDLPSNPDLKAVIEEIYGKSGVVAAVCHGPGGLLSATVDGHSIVYGKKVTGFSDEEETIVQLQDKVPFSLEQKLKELGGEYSSVPAWGVHCVVDGKLVTGQNPGSSKALAEKIIEILSS